MGRFHRATAAVLVTALLLAVLPLLAELAHAANKKKSSQKIRPLSLEQRLKSKKKYVEVIDLMSDIAREQCYAAGRALRRRSSTPTKRYRMPFSLDRRCDLFVEVVEEQASLCDQMVKEMQLTQLEMAERALLPKYYHKLVNNLRVAAKEVLKEGHPSEQQVGKLVSKDMTEWILKTSVDNDDSSSNNNAMDALRSMSPEAKRNLRNQGISMASLGLTDDDADDADEDEDDEDDEDL